MPKLSLEELTTRQSEYLNAVRRAINFPHFCKDEDEARRRIRVLQEEYAAWFAERGIELTYEEN